MVNRYLGEIKINPVPILRNDDFNNEGEIEDINQTLSRAIEVNREISQRLKKLKDYLAGGSQASNTEFNFDPGGYISMRGFSDKELLDMNSKGLIDLFDLATDKDWVKRYGMQFGLVWENGRAVEIN
jgi:hypothetical protein